MYVSDTVTRLHFPKFLYHTRPWVPRYLCTYMLPRVLEYALPTSQTSLLLAPLPPPQATKRVLEIDSQGHPDPWRWVRDGVTSGHQSHRPKGFPLLLSRLCADSLTILPERQLKSRRPGHTWLSDGGV